MQIFLVIADRMGLTYEGARLYAQLGVEELWADDSEEGRYKREHWFHNKKPTPEEYVTVIERDEYRLRMNRWNS